MSLPFKPHTVSVRTASEQLDAGAVALAPSLAAAVAVQGCMQPMTSEQVFKAVGTELREPYKLFMETGDAAKFTVGSHVTWEGRTYVAKHPPTPHNYGLGADYATCILERLEHE